MKPKLPPNLPKPTARARKQLARVSLALRRIGRKRKRR
jgi:hypothetical protein